MVDGMLYIMSTRLQVKARVRSGLGVEAGGLGEGVGLLGGGSVEGMVGVGLGAEHINNKIMSLLLFRGVPMSRVATHH